uniref:Uncharacterized protein n=1 Tax=Haemonchus placei TaxID=6290 RepID=A0A0N4WVU0_HAEPC
MVNWIAECLALTEINGGHILVKCFRKFHIFFSSTNNSHQFVNHKSCLLHSILRLFDYIRELPPSPLKFFHFIFSIEKKNTFD